MTSRDEISDERRIEQMDESDECQKKAIIQRNRGRRREQRGTQKNTNENNGDTKDQIQRSKWRNESSIAKNNEDVVVRRNKRGKERKREKEVESSKTTNPLALVGMRERGKGLVGKNLLSLRKTHSSGKKTGILILLLA